MSTRLVDLIRRHDEVLAQDRDIDRCAHRVEVGQRTVEAALLGQHRDHGGSPGLVHRCQRCGVGDIGERPLGGRRTLHLGNDLDGTISVAQDTQGVLRLGDGLLHFLDTAERNAVLALFQVVEDPCNNVIENAHDAPLSPRNNWTPSRLANNRDARLQRPDARVTTEGPASRRARRIPLRLPPCCGTPRTQARAPSRRQRRHRPAPRRRHP